MNVPAPKRFDIHGRFGGIPLRIQPLFWSASAALGVRYYADPDAGSLGYFGFWMAAVLFCVLLHALCQAWMGRALGVRCEILLYGLGNQIIGLDKLSQCWQRLLVLSAGPVSQFLLLGCLWGLTAMSFPASLREWGWQTSIANGAAILVRITLAWGLLNLVPLWPLTGGRMALEVGEALLGSKGRTAGLVLSLAATALLTVWVVLEMSWRLNFPYDDRYKIYLTEGIVGLLFCFILWLQNLIALWPAVSDDSKATKEPSIQF